MGFTDTQTKQLQNRLDPKHIKPAPRGKFGDYIDGYHAISEANRIFNYDGWSYRVTRIEQVSEQTVTLKNNKGEEYDQYRVGYLAAVEVSAGGVTREGLAVGTGMGSVNTLADHHESAVKEAETDALKRALRSFGNTFGLALYDKTRENVGVDIDPEDEAKMLAEVGKATTDMLNCESKSELRDFLVGAKEKLDQHYYSEIKREATKLAENLPEKAPEPTVMAG